MVAVRAEKVAKVQEFIPQQEVIGSETGGKVLVVGWGGTYGHLYAAVSNLRKDGKDVSLAHFTNINTLPSNTEELFSKYEKIVVCEINAGQFVNYLRMNFQQFDFKQYNKVQGLPFTVIELEEEFNKILEEK